MYIVFQLKSKKNCNDKNVNLIIYIYFLLHIILNRLLQNPDHATYYTSIYIYTYFSNTDASIIFIVTDSAINRHIQYD